MHQAVEASLRASCPHCVASEALAGLAVGQHAEVVVDAYGISLEAERGGIGDLLCSHGFSMSLMYRQSSRFAARTPARSGMQYEKICQIGSCVLFFHILCYFIMCLRDGFIYIT